MALRINNKYTFYHIGKTGGTYVRELLEKISTTKEVGQHPKILQVHCTPLDVPDHIGNDSFCVVRHPLTLYQSNYRYFVKKKKTTVHWITGFQENNSFEQFVKRILKIRPRGFATETYCQFVPFCKYILKQENLTDELNKLLVVNWGFKKILPIPKKNVSDKTINVSLSQETMNHLLNTEKSIIKYLKY